MRLLVFALIVAVVSAGHATVGEGDERAGTYEKRADLEAREACLRQYAGHDNYAIMFNRALPRCPERQCLPKAFSKAVGDDKRRCGYAIMVNHRINDNDKNLCCFPANDVDASLGDAPFAARVTTYNSFCHRRTHLKNNQCVKNKPGSRDTIVATESEQLPAPEQTNLRAAEQQRLAEQQRVAEQQRLGEQLAAEQLAEEQRAAAQLAEKQRAAAQLAERQRVARRAEEQQAEQLAEEQRAARRAAKEELLALEEQKLNAPQVQENVEELSNAAASQFLGEDGSKSLDALLLDDSPLYQRSRHTLYEKRNTLIGQTRGVKSSGGYSALSVEGLTMKTFLGGGAMGKASLYLVDDAPTANTKMNAHFAKEGLVNAFVAPYEDIDLATFYRSNLQSVLDPIFAKDPRGVHIPANARYVAIKEFVSEDKHRLWAEECAFGYEIGAKVREEASGSIGPKSICPFYGCFAQDERVFMVNMYCGEDLGEVLIRVTESSLKEKEPYVPVILYMKVLKQLYEAVTFFKDIGISHNDLKFENVLAYMSPDGTDIHAHIIDFGLAASANIEGELLNKGGSVPYRDANANTKSSERSLKRKNWGADVYSLGVMAFETLFGCTGPYACNAYVTSYLQSELSMPDMTVASTNRDISKVFAELGALHQYIKPEIYAEFMDLYPSLPYLIAKMTDANASERPVYRENVKLEATQQCAAATKSVARCSLAGLAILKDGAHRILAPVKDFFSIDSEINQQKSRENLRLVVESA